MSLPRLLGLVILGLALLAGGATSQNAKDKGDKDKGDKDKKVVKDNLPQFFSGLNLSAEQKAKIGEIQKSFAPKVGELQKKIGELNKQVTELKKDEKSGIFGVLTDDQKKAYDAAVLASKTKKDAPKDKKTDAPKDKKTDPDKK